MMQAYLARHAQTLIGSLGRIVQHPFSTVTTMGVIAVAMALPLLLNLFLQNLRAATGNWNPGFDLTVYLDKAATGSQVQALARQLRSSPDVTGVRVVTAAQGLAEFKQASGFGAALDALTDNPLPDVLIVSPTPGAGTPGGMDALRKQVAARPGVQTVQLDSDWVKRLHAILDLLRRALVLTGALIGIGVMLIVGNTIRLDILNRHAEIEVLKLVGASDGFTRRPFLYAGLWYGLGGGLFALILVASAVAALRGPVGRLALLYGSGFRFEGLGWRSSVGVLASSAALAWLGSWLVATHYIRGIEPT